MASLEFDELSGRYRIRFRYGGQPYKRSLKTTDVKEAQGVLGRVEETIRLLERGRMELPAGAEPGVFVLSDGKLQSKSPAERQHTLEGLLKLYQKSVPKDSKAHTAVRCWNSLDPSVFAGIRGIGIPLTFSVLASESQRTVLNAVV